MPFFYKQVLPTLLNDIMARRILSWKSLFLSRWHQLSSYSIFFLRLFGFFNLRFYLFIFRGEGREKYQCVVPSHAPPLGTWPATQAWALTRNQTSDPLVRRLALSPLSCISQGLTLHFHNLKVTILKCTRLVVFRIFTMFHNHHHYLIAEYFHHARKKTSPF